MEEKRRLTKKEKKELKYLRLKESYKQKKTKRTKRKKAPEDQEISKYKVWIEVLGGLELMTEKEMRSLCEQIRYVYASNRVAQSPVNLIIGNSGLLQGYLRTDVQNWKNIEFKDESITELINPEGNRNVAEINRPTEENNKSKPTDVSDNKVTDCMTNKEEEVTNEVCDSRVNACITENNRPTEENNESVPVTGNIMTDPVTDVWDGLSHKNIIVLTADASDELTEMEEDCVYVIGGLVDRNRHKGYTEKLFNGKFKTAKLPIRQKLSSSTVLSTLHVFNILLSYSQCKDWECALRENLPIRKQSVDEVKPEIIPNSENTLENTSDSPIEE
ncbi:tRNA (guanine9-N1)-methyltransferase [Nematocida sp. ERTm5]|nr:tRNA (guanine9-N1)-methyltransferase [Nematocida sp. ERTm5]